MRIDIITVLPEMFEGPLTCSILKRAQEKGLVEIHVHNLRDYTTDPHKRVDDYAFGFGAGMVLQIEPIDRLITHLKSERNYDEIIFTAPDGERFDQKAANSLSLKENLIILCGHYKGVDQRVRDHLITREYSIGDFVLTGGEMPAAMMTDAIVRLLPGALGDVESALNDSFQDGLLEAGVYTRPAEYKGWKDTGNIYESVAIIAKRANQIAVEIKQDLNKKLAEFASYNDTLEEVFENREQIEISRYYEKLPKPSLLATQEFVEGKIYWRDPSKDNENVVEENSLMWGLLPCSHQLR